MLPGLRWTWVYTIIVTISLSLGIVVTNLTGSLYVIYALIIFAFPSAFISSLGDCLLNGFDVYLNRCDVFPGAYVEIFILNAALYFLMGTLNGLLKRKSVAPK
jgi:hypothetical protein